MALLTPSTAGAFARAMDKVLAARVTDLTIPIADVFDPDKCPTALLPWLAWHLGLTHWSSAWPEHVQRRMIREARQILRERGTRAGVERALTAYGAAVEIVEWWEEAETPGTWRVTVALSESVATDAEAQDEIAEALRRVAPLTRPWSIDVGVSGSAASVVATHPRITALWHVTGDAT